MKRIGELLAPGGKLFIAVNYTSADANAYKGNTGAKVGRSPAPVSFLARQYGTFAIPA